MKQAAVSTLLAVLAVAAAAACGSSSSSGSTTNQTDAGDDSSPVTIPVEASVPEAGAVLDAGPDVDNGAPSSTYPAPHPPLPQLVNGGNGPVLATPKIHLVFYPGYPYEADLQKLVPALTHSAYWGAVTSEYGIGAIELAGSTELTGETAPATITDQQIDAFMNAKIASGAFGAVDTSVIYTIFYPQSTTITMQGGAGGGGTSSSCSSFGGYHSDTILGADAGAGTDVSYAVLPTCPTFGPLQGVDAVTGAASHEWVEAVTDPFPQNTPAYSSTDDDHFVWQVVGGGEAGDLCVPESDAFFKSTELGYTVQRTWSNALAMQSHDPCAPDFTTRPYFNSAPVLDDDVTLNLGALGGGALNTKGVKVAVGQSRTIEVDLFSDGPTSGPWTVKAIDAATQQGQASNLKLTWDRQQGVNGEKLHLTIEVTGKSQFGADAFIIESTLGSTRQVWPGLVAN